MDSFLFGAQFFNTPKTLSGLFLAITGTNLARAPGVGGLKVMKLLSVGFQNRCKNIYILIFEKFFSNT